MDEMRELGWVTDEKHWSVCVTTAKKRTEDQLESAFLWFCWAEKWEQGTDGDNALFMTISRMPCRVRNLKEREHWLVSTKYDSMCTQQHMLLQMLSLVNNANRDLLDRKSTRVPRRVG